MTTSETIDPTLVSDLSAVARTVPGVHEAVAMVRHAVCVASAPTEAPAGTVYVGPDGTDEVQTYPDLLAEAERVLGGLWAAGLRPGGAVLFQFDDDRGYLTSFWACVLGGFLPTPVAVATSYQTPNETNRKLHNAWNVLARPVLLTDVATAQSQGYRAQTAAVRKVNSNTASPGSGPTSSTAPRSAGRTRSSSWAAVPCTPPGCWPRWPNNWPSGCRSTSSTRIRPSPISPG